MIVRPGRGSTTASTTPASSASPVMLATFDVPVAPDAATLAVDTAVESGQQLIVVNAVPLPLRPMTSSWGTDVIVTQDVDLSLRAPAELAHSLSVEVERIRLVSPRPLTALLELVAERAPGLLVVGPDRSRMRARAYRKAARRIAAEAPCLVWLAPE